MSLNKRRGPKGHPGVLKKVNTEIFKGSKLAGLAELATTSIKDRLRQHAALNGSALLLPGQTVPGLFSSEELNFKVFGEETSSAFQDCLLTMGPRNCPVASDSPPPPAKHTLKHI